jgi:hypothetical protein
MSAETIEKQSSLVRTILGDSPDEVSRNELALPTLQLMIDELQAIVARLDKRVA